MSKPNYWVWTTKAQALKPDRSTGNPVPIGYLMEGAEEYFPYYDWVKKGYVERVANKQRK